ncbi:MAG: thiol-disulfide oxidoreductase DCC family protein [Meiothermus sp.]|uniref:thiol-disulfide oxidoreductase DCC family protein n=1 Tax=Meiothermus sp. TaxID=1955249 RepID=UPI0025F270B3|nr:thiol-disulfide oxidoreductase DCC family protein [Meiothermus sp.]MCS7067669.1 thiol-disulfide oxidoreductase DCC family protein [Meiothermus sp.]MDW8425922.1 thiol-disulfide oxidoreductase DCC family protein [Meiothermus sp.]
MEAPIIVLFDGVCNLCNGVVRFIVRHDPEGRFRFAAQQSAVGQALLEQYGVPASEALADSVVVIEGGRAYLESDAALVIVRHLKGYGWLRALRHLPKPLRDGLYRLIARHRYRIFGRQASCPVPTPELRERFLEKV